MIEVKNEGGVGVDFALFQEPEDLFASTLIKRTIHPGDEGALMNEQGKVHGENLLELKKW